MDGSFGDFNCTEGWSPEKKVRREKEERDLLYPGVLLESKSGRSVCLIMVVVVFLGFGFGHYSRTSC